MRMYNPPHPGVFLKQEIFQAHGLSITAAAKVLGVSRVAISRLTSAKTSLTPEMALRFEKAFDLSMDTLMRMQTSFDIAKARKAENKIKVKRYEQRVQ